MKALRSFTVKASLPPDLAPLGTLAMNLRWSWDEQTRDLFRWVDPDQWERTVHDPIKLLGGVSRERLDALTHDRSFMGFLDEVHGTLRRYLEGPRWFQTRSPGPLRAIAYFSPEFGLSEAIPQYSGGLGVLAGDHLKAASGLGLPLTGIGLLYRQGYFRQELNADGWQQERYPQLDPHAMALTAVEGARVEVDLAGAPLAAQVWRADVGRVRLYFLDADLDENTDEGREVTDRLYGGDTEHRLRQEILLGIGGVRALPALGVDAQVFHTNEGHAGFLGLERIRQLMTSEGLSFTEAIESVRSGTVFTTHTPVSAGIDQFPRELMGEYFSDWTEEVGVPFDELMALGQPAGAPPDAPFNMAIMGLRLAGLSNGVSRLHGDTSRKMFAYLWPDIPVDEVPITSITNGVHAPTWVAPEMADLFSRYVLPTWSEAGPKDWERIFEARDDELWRAQEVARARLISVVRERVKRSMLARGVSASDSTWCEEILDPHILTVGFARRFATYKRADLMLSQPDRLKRLLLSTSRPVQILFAGKAHPHDDAGKEMIRRVLQFSRDPEVRHRIVFVDDYDIAIARAFYQGCDVWLNNPRRPEEASGTSGEKAAANGALNLSILDGWWDEMFDGENGWAISSAEGYDDLARRDEVEANSLFDILEHQVIPLFYDRFEGPVPRRWVQRMKSSLCSLGPRVTAARMVRDYVEQLYEPLAAHADTMTKSGHARSRAVADWKTKVTAAWSGVNVLAVDTEAGITDLGDRRRVEAVVSIGKLTGDDVAVQLVHGVVAPNDELIHTEVVDMQLVSLGESDGEYRFGGEFVCTRAGRHGFTVRVAPNHPDQLSVCELGLMQWA